MTISAKFLSATSSRRPSSPPDPRNGTPVHHQGANTSTSMKGDVMHQHNRIVLVAAGCLIGGLTLVVAHVRDRENAPRPLG